MNAEFFRWLREWDPACQTAHDRIYHTEPMSSYAPVLCGDGFAPYTRGQANVVIGRCIAIRSGSVWINSLGSTRIAEVHLLAMLIIAAHDGTEHDIADLTDRLRESQANVMLSGGES